VSHEQQALEPLDLAVNGRRHTVNAAAHEPLAYVLRNRLGLTGTKVSCDVQVCGACTVLVDGAPVRSCTYLAYEADGREVQTVEGLADAEGGLDPVQRAFLEDNAFQCGFCTGGMLLAAHAWLRDIRAGEPTEELLDYLGGNICRCTGYVPIVSAVLRALDGA
jgi:aerobic-type carbon monoxide dehydrogenase small subunit (CoxS/CutS family)